MAKTSFVDHVARTGIPGHPKLKNVTNSEEWGARKAEERYNQGVRVFPSPPERSLPQDPVDKPGDRSYNEVRESSWLRGGPKESAQGKPNFDPRGRDGLPKKW